jgi:hypothetical protein
LSNIAHNVVLQNPSESRSEGMMRWKFGVVFLRFDGTWLISPFSSCNVVFDGILNGEWMIAGSFGRHR